MDKVSSLYDCFANASGFCIKQISTLQYFIIGTKQYNIKIIFMIYVAFLF